MKILIIDDDQFFSVALAASLKPLGHEVMIASNGAKGLSLVRRFSPDLILCDIIMPIMNGLQVRKAIEREPEYQHIPFIFLSGRDNPEDIATGLGLGASEYLIKPILLETLVEHIQQYQGEHCA